jgi:hypothetical protein
MSRSVQVPDFGDSGALYMTVEVPGPSDPGYTAVRLPEGDPWALTVNQAKAEMEAELAKAEHEAELEAGS